jgi:hypothetical protein
LEITNQQFENQEIRNPIEMFKQAAMLVENVEVFGRVRSAIEGAFAPGSVGKFLKSVEKAKLRVRNYEAVMERGLLGSGVPAEYAALGDADRGQVRELYLARVEQVVPELRAKFFKVYAYY